VQQHTGDQAESGLLYHYTTLDGLLGILDKGELWESGILYLNDTSEFKAASTAAFDVAMADSQYGEVSSGLNDYNSIFRYSAAHPESVYTVSFSAEASGDDLSQWRAYSGPSSGVSLGFSPQYLRSISKRFLCCDENIGWIAGDQDPLMKCEYYKDNVAADTSNAIYDELRRTMAIKDSHTKVQRFVRYAATLKHEKFRAEQEWRIALIWGGLVVPEAVKFRRARSLVVPYVPIPLRYKDQLIQIDRIVVGPTPHRDEARLSIEMLLKRYRVEFKKVVSSQVPYRNW
jgi:hypothetical protein